MMYLIFVHQLETTVVRCLEDGVCGVPTNDLGHPLCNPLLDSKCREAEDVLTIGFVLRVTVVCNLLINGAVVGVGTLGSHY